MMRLARYAIWFGQRRGTVAVLTALAMPALMGSAGLAIDVGIWYREGVRLQLAADAGAMGAARLLSSSTTTSAYQAAALIEVNGVTGGASIGTVTLTSTPDSYFTRAIGITASTITASATASGKTTSPAGCVLALSTTASQAIKVDNQGSIVANGCGIFSNSSAAQSIYLNSGTISSSVSIGARGGVVKSNSGSNTLYTPPGTSPSSNVATPETDPLSGTTTPNPGSCDYNNLSDTNYQSTPYLLTPGVYCGNTTIGGNGSSDTFAPGIYYIVNGTLTFNNANVTSAPGVTFVLAGSSPGSLQWTNYANTTTMTASASGAYKGILVYQACNSSGSDPASSFNGGGTLQASGEIYTPCGAINLSNNAQLKPATTTTGGVTTTDNFGVVAQTIYAAGSAGLTTYAGSSSSSSSSSVQVSLLQ
jgi:Flp pilus assembly protein TadG